jgi:hypothetical protein
MAPRLDGYRHRALTSTSGGVAQRWVLIASEQRLPQAQRTVDRQLLKHGKVLLNIPLVRSSDGWTRDIF